MEQLRQAAGNGPQTRKLLDTLFRSVHNYKATASANGLTSLAAAAHEFENVLHSLRKHAIAEGELIGTYERHAGVTPPSAAVRSPG